MPAPVSSVSCTDPWLLRQICDELEAMQAAGEDVPEAAFSVAEDLGHLIDEGVSPRVIAEHAVELAKRLQV
jgi:hypothetical protein